MRAENIKRQKGRTGRTISGRECKGRGEQDKKERKGNEAEGEKVC